MICVILAAGMGSRLKPITNFIPKCLVPVQEKPILTYWLDKLDLFENIEEVIINTHYLSNKVSSYIKKEQNKHKYKITEFYEKELLGSAGTIYANKNKLNGKDVLIIYADNFSQIDLKGFYDKYKLNKRHFNIAVFEAEVPEKCGIFEVDANENVVSFEEKPKIPKSNLANSGIYLFDGSIYFSKISGNEFDIGFDVLPQFISLMKVYKINGFHVDIGTHELLAKANSLKY
jgi:mannose-1-phosphate guanylyltransferase